jgi:alpha-1,2-mannosyltransferase
MDDITDSQADARPVKPGALQPPNRDRNRTNDLKKLNLACWGIFGAFLMIRFIVPLSNQLKTGVQTLKILPADFIYFYGIGRIANHYPLANLYDYVLQLKVFNEIYPLSEGAYGPSPYPPFVALFFAPFARLPFGSAFALWMTTSLFIYLIGVGAAINAIFPREPLKASLFFCYALAFYPFLIGTLINGQLAAVAVFAIGLTIAGERSGKLFLSGLALSILAYKPTLLVLIVPLLVLTRRFRAIGGLIAGCAALFIVSTAFGGFAVWPAYARFVRMFGRVASLTDRSGLPLTNFVDIGSCLQAIAGGRSVAATAAALIATCVVAVALSVLWWRSAKASRPAQLLAWATALTWTLLINIYVPIYDTVLVVVAIVLTLGALRELGWKSATDLFAFAAIFTLGASWITSPFAADHHVQMLSIFLAILGCSQLYFLYGALGSKAQTKPAAEAPAPGR